MASISGQSTTNIDGVDGFFTSSGGGGTASTSPTLSVDVNPFVVTLTISNYASYTNPNWEVSVFVGATEVVTNANVTRSIDSNLLSATLTWSTDTNASASNRTVKVRAQEFGDYIQSAEVTTTYANTTVQSRFLRLRGVTSAGVDTSDRIALGEVRFFDASGQTGTRFASGNMTSDLLPTSEGLSLSQGNVYSASYESWKAMDGSGTTMAWLLGASAANNWWQCEFLVGTYPTIPIIKSLEILQRTSADTAYISIQGSDDGLFTTDLVEYGVYNVPNDQTTTNIG